MAREEHTRAVPEDFTLSLQCDMWSAVTRSRGACITKLRSWDSVRRALGSHGGNGSKGGAEAAVEAEGPCEPCGEGLEGCWRPSETE